ncbi:GSCOCG00002673001-RA-CDS [Cotesia congregata]|uniref:Similar to xmas-2: Protein xmas-2 (Drosophila melanogaster) n=1 Tax=Cotesia congregata TaxID=51543 RepID=A0A8J2MLD9_COTCN|nr:GSCOCG00002673001-RA-CDS [Cotesia congregata]CAG5093690.1 Similar to xmas-2: Protein xmas-2 (Drosophila melanogaster) [Cotesia congregata]
MFAKGVVKKKDVNKIIASYLSKIEDDEVKSELEAMSGLEYNLPGEKNSESVVFSTNTNKKTKGNSGKESSKVNEKNMENVKSSKEKKEVESQIPSYMSSNVSVTELRKIITQAGNTSEDRYKILEARDRLMRLKKAKIHTLSMAKVTRGTCPDMCPEKERLMREFQRQVSAYELIEGNEYKIDHQIAVKQYSRSSADQEEPMPQDLRPVNILKMTMSYLLHEIADLCEENGTNLAEWYHFMWDRTRGIRKDITQQELCCLESVALVEQCARFHIVSSERLCAEELSVFDGKINTENLTKCLQTLKYMYADLREKGIVCKNEAEFRAYIILLNLNNSNFMWDLQTLPESIRKSPQVNFAIRVHGSIQAKNWIKFFKLVRSTTYLNASILIRYFLQVRVEALSVMIKAFCRTSSTSFPLYEFIDMLGFEDENEAIDFCEQAGLSITEDEMYILIDRKNICLPPPVSCQIRAKSLVQSKRIKINYSIGQCIAGDTMPEQLYLNHRPHCSFDEHGYLKAEAINASDQNGEVEEVIEVDMELMEETFEEKTEEGISKDEGAEVEDEEMEEEQEEEVEEEDEDEDADEIEKTDPYEFVEEDTSDTGLTQTFERKPKVHFSDNFTSVKFNKFSEDSSEILKPGVNEAKSLFDVTDSSKKNQVFNSAIFTQSTSHSSSIFTTTQSKDGVNAHPLKSIFSKPESGFSEPRSLFSGKSSTSQPATVTIPVTSSIFGNSSSNFKLSSTPVPVVSEDVAIKEKKKENEEKNRAEFLRKIEETSECIAKELEQDVINTLSATVLKEVIEESKIFERNCQKIFENILDHVINDNCRSILDNELYIEKKVEELSKRVKKRIVCKYVKIWQKKVIRNRVQRRALENTPVWLSHQSLKQCAKNMFSKEQKLVIELMRNRYTPKDSCDSRKFIDPVEVTAYLGIKENAKTLDIETTPISYWKMIISWPLLDQRPLLRRYQKIMTEYLCPRDPSMDPIVKIYQPNPYETLAMCIKNVEGVLEDHHYTGNDGLFLISTVDEDAKVVARRLTKSVLARQKLMAIPLVLVIIGADAESSINVEPTAELKSLVKSGYLSEYVIHREKVIDESILLKLTQTAVRWLTMNKSPPVPLEMDSLYQVVDTCLTEELWLRITGHASYSSILSTALEDPKFVVDLHNETISHLIDIVLDPENTLHTSFPDELKPFLPKEFTLPCTYEYFNDDWKNEEQRVLIERTINNLSLPPWRFEWPISDPTQLHKSILSYSKKALKENYSSSILMNRLFLMIDRNETLDFIQIVIEITKQKIKNIDPEVCVVFNRNHFKHFCTLPWWLKSSTLMNVKPKFSEHVFVEPANKKQRLTENRAETMAEIQKYESFCSIEEDKPEIDTEDIHNASMKLEALLSQHSLSSQLLEEKLKAALSSD